MFFSKNWRESEKVFKYPLFGGFFIGNILILSREFLEISAKNDGYVFSEVIYGGIILSAIISLFIAGAILFSYAPQDWQRNGSSHHSSHQFSPVNNQNLNDDSAETYYTYSDDDSFSSRIETNPATGLLSCGELTQLEICMAQVAMIFHLFRHPLTTHTAVLLVLTMISAQQVGLITMTIYQGVIVIFNPNI
ncbi:hypothetical protein WH390_15815 (plasmid) [Candidatus Arsenophonus nilaparvatae]|uniref:hypothetical protein n=1 Tax=Candidatus Arsenophonus nilaparvatae TaxID=1247023 RepID=UPI0037C178E5